MAPQEPTFFGRDLDYNRPARGRPIGLSGYLDLFRDVRGASVVGEKSPFYLVSESAASEIHEFNPDARIIIMLRNPVDAAYSLHGQFMKNCNENIRSFPKAFGAQEARRRGRRLPRSCYFPGGLQYTKVYSYADSVARYLRVFGEDKVHVVIYDDFSRDPESSYRDVLEFLEIDPTFKPEFKVHMPVVHVRSVVLQRFRIRWERWERQYAAFRFLPGRVRDAVRWRLRALNEKAGSRPPLSPDFQDFLKKQFSEDVGRVGALLGRDLGHWCGNAHDSGSDSDSP